MLFYYKTFDGEMKRLEQAEPGYYFLFAPPVKIEGVDGAPVRAVLIEDYVFWSRHPSGKKP